MRQSSARQVDLHRRRRRAARAIRYHAGARGHASALCASTAADAGFNCEPAAWQRTQETDAWGNVVGELRAEGARIPITRSYNPLNGLQTGLCAGVDSCDLVKELYSWDAAGNLSAQQKEGRYIEAFQYDALNRLTTGTLVMVNGVTTNTLTQWQQYDALGNICAKLFRGATTAMGYGGRAGCGATTTSGSGGTGYVGPHRLTTAYAAGGNWAYAWDAHGNQTVRDAPGTVNDRTIQYSVDDHAYEIVTGNGQRTRYWYGADGQRYKREDADGTRTLYVGQVEVVLNGAGTTYRRNIAGVLIKTDGAQPQDARYVFTDRLGSVVKYTDAQGVVVQPQDFDGWGQRRNPTDPSQAGTAPVSPPGLRGFTGHEMVDGQDVIHMNARLYDPMLGRFLQADPLVQAPQNLQSWNAYTYVLNNPLTLIDPTGMFSWRKLLGVFGQILNIVSYFITALKPFAMAFNIVMGMANGGIKGGLLAAFGSQIPAFDHFATNLLVGTLYGGASSMIMGGSFKQGIMGSLKSAAIGMVLGAMAQGVKSRQTGGKYGSGADSDTAVAQHAPGDSGRERRVTVITKEINDEFDQISARFRGKTYNTWQEADNAFAEAYLPFTEEYNLEVGANVTKCGPKAFRVEDWTLGVNGAVATPMNSMTYYEEHTHPSWGGDSFSGRWERYSNGKYLATEDYNHMAAHSGIAFQFQGSIVHRAGDGGMWLFDYNNFKGYISRSKSENITVYGAWSVRRVK